MRPQSNSGLMLEDAENGQNISVPANYKSPTQEQQLESNRKLSNRLERRTSLPGTPEWFQNLANEDFNQNNHW